MPSVSVDARSFPTLFLFFFLNFFHYITSANLVFPLLFRYLQIPVYILFPLSCIPEEISSFLSDFKKPSFYLISIDFRFSNSSIAILSNEFININQQVSELYVHIKHSKFQF